MQLETERLVLRELTSLDFDALYAVLGDSDIMQHYPYTFDETRVRRWIQKNQERYHVFGFGLWAVVLKETGELIGDCGLTMQNVDGVILPEIGYHIAKAHQRRGYAREAARACRDWAFQSTPFQMLFSYMKQSNTAPPQRWQNRTVCVSLENFGMKKGRPRSSMASPVQNGSC